MTACNLRLLSEPGRRVHSKQSPTRVRQDLLHVKARGAGAQHPALPGTGRAEGESGRAAAAATGGLSPILPPRRTGPSSARRSGGKFALPGIASATGCLRDTGAFLQPNSGGDEPHRRVPPAPLQPPVLTPSTGWDPPLPAADSVPPQPPLPARALTHTRGMTEPVPGAGPPSCHGHGRAAPAGHCAEPPHAHSTPAAGRAPAWGQNAQWGAMTPRLPAPRLPAPRRAQGCDSAPSAGTAPLSPLLSVLCPGDQGLTGSFQSSDLSQ